ncbi:hypothetical protein Tco_0948764 [Tanacetum coccineum]
MKSSGYGVLSLLVMDVFVNGIGGGGDGVLKAKSSGVIGERVRVMSIAIDDEDVPLVDGVLDGLFGAFGDRGCCFSDGVLASSCVRSMNNFLGGIKVILVSWKLLRLRFEKMPWKYLRLKMSEEDDNLKVKSGNHFIKRKWCKNGMG